MKATIHAAENERTRIGKIIGENIYVKAIGKKIPEDFVIYSVNADGRKCGIKPCADYQEARDLVKKLNAQQEAEK